MEDEIKKYLEQYNFINFALIFGSYAIGKVRNKSDLDVGIFFDKDFDLLFLGKIITDLEKNNKKENRFIRIEKYL